MVFMHCAALVRRSTAPVARVARRAASGACEPPDCRAVRVTSPPNCCVASGVFKAADRCAAAAADAAEAAAAVAVARSDARMKTDELIVNLCVCASIGFAAPVSAHYLFL